VLGYRAFPLWEKPYFLSKTLAVFLFQWLFCDRDGALLRPFYEKVNSIAKPYLAFTCNESADF
jgi:hypothetical protein